MAIEIKSWDVYRVIKSFTCRTERIPTSFDLICLCIVSDIWSFGLSDLHKAVFLNFSQCNILFIPLQAADAKDQLHLTRPDPTQSHTAQLSHPVVAVRSSKCPLASSLTSSSEVGGLLQCRTTFEFKAKCVKHMCLRF